MTIQRVTNSILYTSTLRNVNQTQQELFNLQDQISSKLKTRNFQGLNGSVEQFIDLESRINRSTLFRENNAVQTARLETANQALDSITTAADDIKNLILARRNGATGTSLNFSSQLRDKLQELADSANASIEGRYLFSGTATDTPPIPDISVRPLVVGVPDTSYYAGSTTSVKTRADESVEFDFPVRADDEAFQNIFAAANLALQADQGNDDAGFKRAFDIILKGQEGIVSAQARVNSAIVNVSNISDRQDQLQLYWRGLTEQISRTDIIAATTEVANNEATLQASYQVFARLTRLRLSDFLN